MSHIRGYIFSPGRRRECRGFIYIGATVSGAGVEDSRRWSRDSMPVDRTCHPNNLLLIDATDGPAPSALNAPYAA